MSLRSILVISVILIIGIGVTAYVAVSDRVLPFTDPLRATGVESDESERLHEYITRFRSESSSTSATAAIEARSYSSDGYELRVNIVHDPGTRIDAFEMTFGLGGDPDALALRTPGGYPWPPLTYHVADDGRSVLVAASDLGVQGRGSLTLDFLLDPVVTTPGGETITMTLVFELHDDGLLKLTKHRAETTLDIRLPARKQSWLNELYPVPS